MSPVGTGEAELRSCEGEDLCTVRRDRRLAEEPQGKGKPVRVCAVTVGRAT